MSLSLSKKNKQDLDDATLLNIYVFNFYTYFLTRIKFSATNLVLSTSFQPLRFSTFNSHKLCSEILFQKEKLCIRANALAFHTLTNRLIVQNLNPTYTVPTHVFKPNTKYMIKHRVIMSLVYYVQRVTQTILSLCKFTLFP